MYYINKYEYLFFIDIFLNSYIAFTVNFQVFSVFSVQSIRAVPKFYREFRLWAPCLYNFIGVRKLNAKIKTFCVPRTMALTV